VLALRLFEHLPRRPIVTVASAMALVETTKPTAGRAIDLLAAAGVLVETTGRKRDRSYAYQAYLNRLRIGTELGETDGHGPGQHPIEVFGRASPSARSEA
jgi:hypothetical protein